MIFSSKKQWKTNVKFPWIVRRTTDADGTHHTISTQNVICSYKDMCSLAYNTLSKLSDDNGELYKEKYATVKFKMWYVSSQHGEVGCFIPIESLFNEIQINTGVSSIGVNWILNKLQEEGYDAWTTIEGIHIYWKYRYPLTSNIRSPSGKRWLTIIGISLVLFVWFNVSGKLPNWLSWLRIIDSGFIAIIGLIWVYTRIPSFLEQVGAFNQAFGSSENEHKK